MRGAVALVVVLAVAAPLAGLEPGDRWDPIRVLAPRRLQHRAGHGPPLRALHGPVHAPGVGLEPGLGCPGDHARDGRVVDAVVVPVEQEDEVVEPQPPGRVARLVAGAGREAALALDHEDLDLLGPGQLERNRLTGRRRHAVPRRPGVELQEEGLALHLGVAGEAAATSQLEEVLPGERPAAVIGEGEGGVRVTLGAGAQHLVEDGQRRVHERHGVAGREHEPIRERPPRLADVPAHGAGEEERQEHVDLGARAAGVAALAVVQRQVDRLVDDLPDRIPALELRDRLVVEAIRRPLLDGGHAWTSWPVRSSLASDSPTRSSAALIFSRELA